MELLLVRHALPVRRELVDGAADPELSADGHAQAEHLATYLSSEHLDAIYASPLRRAYQTASAVATPRSMDVVLCDGVAEYDRLSPDYVPVEELKAENDPRYHAVIGGEWLSVDETADEFRGRVVNSIEVDRRPSRAQSRSCVTGRHQQLPVSRAGAPEPRGFFYPNYTSINRIAAAWRAAVDRDHQRDVAPARHRVADGSVPGTVMADLDDLIAFWLHHHRRGMWYRLQPDRLVAAGSNRSTSACRGVMCQFAVSSCAVPHWLRGAEVLARQAHPCASSAPTPIHPDCASSLGPTPVVPGGAARCRSVRRALINSWLDRDLGIAGRAELTDGTTVDVAIDEAVCRSAAGNPSRSRRPRAGLILDKQQHLVPVWGSGAPRAGEFAGG